MGQARHEYVDKKSWRGRRTYVVGSADTGSPLSWIRAKAREWSGIVWRHTPAWMQRLAREMMTPKVLLPLGLIGVLMIAAATHFYMELSGEIDARLKGRSLDDSVRIVTSPLKLSVGDGFSLQQIAETLQAAGYVESNAPAFTGPVGSYKLLSNSIAIYPGQKGARSLGLFPSRITVSDDGRVKSIERVEAGAKVNSVMLEGEILASVRDGNRQRKSEVRFSDIPVNSRNAVLSVEDRRFFSHSGIDWRGIARALREDLAEGEIVQGGSTITQQLIKNTFLTSDRTFARKIKEAAMAIILESRLSKEEIFTLYCNEVYLGQGGAFGIHGLAEGAQFYFDKPLSELTLGESAFLAGLIHAPNRYSSHRDNSRAVERRNLVLDSMVATGAISQDEADRAKREPLKLKKHETVNDYGKSYFLDYAQRYIDSRYGSKGFKAAQDIITTLDARLQKVAYRSVTEHAERLDKIFARSARKGKDVPPVQAALVALDVHTGEVLAMVGGRSYDESQLNRATDARRQPGSTFKPFVYAAALQMRAYTAATLISDRPRKFTYGGGRAVYSPTNFHGAYTNRDVTLREALTRSLNVPAVEIAMRVGLGNIAELAENCGLERPQSYPSMALGASEATPLELASAYTAFANQGVALKPLPVRRVTGPGLPPSNGDLRATGIKVLSPQVAYLMTDLMRSVVDSGTASRLRAMGLKGALAGKTGTSDDGWFVGYTPSLVCAVWVGFDDNRDTHMKASDSALPIWADFVKQATELRPDLGGESFPRPGGLVTVEIDPHTGLIATGACLERQQELFISGSEPSGSCNHEIPGFDIDSEEESDSWGSDERERGYNSIALNICSRLGKAASFDCPFAQRRVFELGEEPLDMCRHTRSDNEGHEPYQEPSSNDRSDRKLRGESEEGDAGWLGRIRDTLTGGGSGEASPASSRPERRE